MKKIQKLEAPITLTLDQIAMVAAGQSAAGGNTIRSGGKPTGSPGSKGSQGIATNSSIKVVIQ